MQQQFRPVIHSDRAKWEQAQLEHLRSHVSMLAERSAFYKRKFEALSLAPEDLRSLADLKKFPFTERQDLQNDTDQFLCIPRDRCIDRVSTSGTLGEPVTILLSAHDLQRLAANEHNSLSLAGVGPQDVVQLMTTMDRRFMAGLAYTLGARSLGAGLVRMGPGAIQEQWNIILKERTTVLIVVPSFLVAMLDHAKTNRIDPAKSSVRKAICIGQPITNSDRTPNKLAHRILEDWNIELLSTYASTEMATASTEAVPCSGAIIPSQLMHVELLDDKGDPVEDGEPGEVVATPFHVEAMPLLRLRTGDISTLRSEMHPTLGFIQKLGPVLGRRAQRLKVKGTTLYPNAVSEVVRSIPTVKDHLVIATTDEMGEDGLQVLINSLTDLSQVVMDRCRASLGVAPSVDKVEASAIQLIRAPLGKRKPVFFLDQRSNTTPIA